MKITDGMLSGVVLPVYEGRKIPINTSIRASSSNYTNSASRDVKYIVIHYTGNTKDTALNNAKYFQNGSRSASAHFFVDDNNIYQSVELRDQAWHSGSSTGYKTACRNSNSIGIEMCTSGNYMVSTITQSNTIYLAVYLCKKLGITAQMVDTYVLRHYDVVKSNKKCPKQFVDNPAEWENFKNILKVLLK